MKRLEEILLEDNIVESINKNLDELLKIIPEIKNMIGFPHNHPHHHLDVWNHTLSALSLSPKKFEIRLALLLHDIGKPFSYQDEEVRHFKGHALKSKKMSETILLRLGYDAEFINYISTLIENHDTPINLNNIKKEINYHTDLFMIQFCDALAHHPEKLEKRKKYLLTVLEKFKNINLENVLTKDKIKLLKQ